MRVVIALVMMVGCGAPDVGGSEPSGADEPAGANPATAHPANAEPDPRYADAPAGAEAIARQLRARHREDLPDRDALAAHPEPEASLRWLVENGDPLVVRMRAASSLRFFASPESSTLLRAIIGDESLPGNLRAAAVEGTAGASLDPAFRAELEAAAASSDPRLARAARERLDTSPPAPTTP